MLVRSPAPLAFSVVVGEANPAAQTLDISNGGGATLEWSLDDDAPWLDVSPARGSATDETDVVTVEVNSAGLGPGTHTATLMLTAPDADGSPQIVAVTLTLAEPAPVLVRSPAARRMDGATDGSTVLPCGPITTTPEDPPPVVNARRYRGPTSRPPYTVPMVRASTEDS